MIPILKALIDPVALVVVAMGCAVWGLRPRGGVRSTRWWRVALIAVVALYAGGMKPIAAGLISALAVGCPMEASPGRGIDAVVILGAGTSDVGIHGNGTPSADSAVRLLAGLEAFRVSGARYLVLSGGPGSGNRIAEAEVMAHVARDAGITNDRLLIDGHSQTTHEHAVELSRRAELRGLRLGVVTSAAHTRRAALAFGPYFDRVVMLPAGCPSRPRAAVTTFIPSARWLSESAAGLYELAGLVRYRIGAWS